MKHLLVIFTALLLASCNIRENSLLPPDLTGEFYRTGNVVSEYANFLIKSSNDNAYLFLPMESISDSIIHYQDEIIFERRQSLALRDSVKLSDNFSELRDTYYVGIRRNNQLFDLKTEQACMRIYAHTATGDHAFIVAFDGFLTATAVDISNRSGDRAWTPVYSTGEQGLYSIVSTPNPGFSVSNSHQTHALIASGNTQIALNFTAEYCQGAGNISVTQSDLPLTAQQNLATLYPNFALSSLPLNVSTQNPTNLIAQIRIREPAQKLFARQWVRVDGTGISTWEQGDASNPNWSTWGSDTYSFIVGSGAYCFVTPLSSQNEITMPLDGSFRQVYLDKYWFDLMDLNLDGYSMKIDLEPSINSIRNTYLSGSPFSHSGLLESFGISFWQDTSPIRQLPDGSYLEFGYRSQLSRSPNLKLMTVYRDSHEDWLTYKTLSSSYSAETFTMIQSWIYASLAVTGTVICGDIQLNGLSFDIPFAKNQQYLSTEYIDVFWNHDGVTSFSKAHFDLSPTGAIQHPWFQGEPFTPGSLRQIVDYSFYRTENSVEDVPAEFYLALKQVPKVQDLVLFDPNYPRLKAYQQSDTAGYSTYTYANQILGIAPTTAGKLISSALNNPNPLNVRVYPKMEFVVGDTFLYTSGYAPSGSSAILSIQRQAASGDPYGILANQYSLTQTSPVLRLNAPTATFYETYMPALYFRRQRRNEIIVYETNEDFYRFYPYQSSSSLDPWHFVVDEGFNGILPAYDGEYTSYTDNDVHTMIPTQVSTLQRDHIVSLYQAQFVLPQFYIPAVIPMGSRIGLSKLDAVPGVASVLSAYMLSIKTAAGIDMNPTFYNVIGAIQEPYLYIPLDDASQLATAGMYYRSLSGEVHSLTRVDEFSSDNWANEFRVVGNSFICTVNNPGWYYLR